MLVYGNITKREYCSPDTSIVYLHCAKTTHHCVDNMTNAVQAWQNEQSITYIVTPAICNYKSVSHYVVEHVYYILFISVFLHFTKTVGGRANVNSSLVLPSKIIR